jgi:hypothetical protein
MNEHRMRTHNAYERAILTEKGIRHWLDDRRWAQPGLELLARYAPLLPLNDLMPEPLTRIAFPPNPRNPRLSVL